MCVLLPMWGVGLGGQAGIGDSYMPPRFSIEDACSDVKVGGGTPGQRHATYVGCTSDVPRKEVLRMG